MTQNKLYKTVDGVKTEMTPEEKEAFLTDVEAQRLLEAKESEKKQLRIDAITKLGAASGLTEEEINSILNI
jgi:hypothetical protein